MRGMTSVPPADPSIGAFSTTPPWLIDPSELQWRARRRPACGPRTAAQVPDLLRRRRLPPGRRVVRVGGELARPWPRWYLIDRRRAAGRAGRNCPGPGLSRRLRHAFQTLGPDLHQARPDPLVRRGPVPRRAGRRVPAAPRPGAAGAVRGGPGRRRGGSGPPARGRLHPLRPDPARRRLDRPGPRRPPPDGRGGGGKSAAPRGRHDRAHGPGRHELDRPLPHRPHPGSGAGQSAGPGRAVRRDHRRGARLPPRGRQHARHRLGAGHHRPALGGRPPTPPGAGHPPGPGHGAPDGFSFDDVAGMHAGGHRHRRRWSGP